jgi:hypothetical protein
MAGTWEVVIDVVCFLDIFVWFNTGELDRDGVVVPKSFFPRFILPGTLVQVLDHPTLPNKLPHLLSYSIGAVSAAGYSRVFRWALALFPALDMLLVDPVKSYLFRPMDDDEWLRYTESLAIIPALSGANIRNAMSYPNMMGAMRRTESSADLSYASVSNSQRQIFSGSLDDSFSFGYSLHY